MFHINNRNTIIGIIAVILVIAIGCFVYFNSDFNLSGSDNITTTNNTVSNGEVTMNVTVFKDTNPTNRINSYVTKFNNTNNTTIEKETLVTDNGNITKTVLTRPKGNTTEQITRYWVKKDNETRVYTTVNGNMDSDNFAKILAKSE